MSGDGLEHIAALAHALEVVTQQRDELRGVALEVAALLDEIMATATEYDGVAYTGARYAACLRHAEQARARLREAAKENE